MAARQVAIGIDLGGTKIAGGLVDTSGTLSGSRVVPTRAGAGAETVMAALVAMVDELVAEAAQLQLAVVAVGLASAGLIDVTSGRVLEATDALPGFAGTDLRGRLTAATGFSVAVVNDGQALALAEQRHGAGRECSEVLYVAVGTGVGGAIVSRGALLAGSGGVAGDLGHLLVAVGPTARRCGCGHTGHLEAYVSGPALLAEYVRRAGESSSAVDLPTVVARAAAGEALAAAVLGEGAVLLGRVLGGVANLLAPEAIVFGGGLSSIPRPQFWDHVAIAIAGEVRGRPPRLLRAELGEAAALVGAASLAHDTFTPARGETSIT